MKNYLIFQLYGGMASWGDIAMGEIRPSYRHPSKSAVIGLVAAALGINRNSYDKQQELFKLLFSVRVDTFGIPIDDYHTIQAPSEQALKGNRADSALTRADEVEAIRWRIIQSRNNKEAGAILSRRTYYCDALYTVAFCENEKNPSDWNCLSNEIFKIQDVIKYLENPVFHLYLGRKSCPLALPMQAQIQKGHSCQDAIKKAEFNFQEELTPLIKLNRPIAWYSEEKLPNSKMKMTRRDQPVNKINWQFTNREEYYASGTETDL